jgi:uncharacterized Zn finger protein
LTAAAETSAVLTELMHAGALRDRAAPGAWESGLELKAQELASLRVIAPKRVVALVWDGRAEEVEVCATERGLAWHCSCGLSGATGFCSHSVAAILLMLEREGDGRLA